MKIWTKLINWQASKDTRTNLIFGLVFLLFLGLGGRLFYLQVLRGEYYQALAERQQEFLKEVELERGEIFLQNRKGELFSLARNKRTKLVFLVPRDIENKEETSQVLSDILALDKEFILSRMVRKESFFEVLKRRLEREEIAKLKKLNLSGVHLQEEIIRYYPQDEFAAHVVGFLGGEGIGQYGIEGYYDGLLREERKILRAEKGPEGFLVFGLEEIWSPEQNNDIVLTIDYNIQFMAEKLLRENKEIFEFEQGTIIVMNSKTGAILALANNPSFNPNYFYQREIKTFKNPAFQKLFEPGSVLKPITMAIALDQGKITPETIFIDKGMIEVEGHKITNFDRRTWGEKSISGILEKSVNTGIVFVREKIDNQLFLDGLEKFGFFKPTGIDLQGEVFSRNKYLRKGRDINLATASFGQGIKITPIQLIRAFGVFANEGRIVNPFLKKRILQEQGQEIEKKDNQQILSSQTAEQVTQMLINTVEDSWLRRAQIPGYFVAGKTGTAQIPLKGGRGYHPYKTIQSFIGFAPALEPEFVILVKLNNPNTRTAGSSAAPIFQELAKFIINYFQIFPDY